MCSRKSQGPPHAPTGDLWEHVLRVLELLAPKLAVSLIDAVIADEDSLYPVHRPVASLKLVKV